MNGFSISKPMRSFSKFTVYLRNGHDVPRQSFRKFKIEQNTYHPTFSVMLPETEKNIRIIQYECFNVF